MGADFSGKIQMSFYLAAIVASTGPCQAGAALSCSSLRTKEQEFTHRGLEEQPQPLQSPPLPPDPPSLVSPTLGCSQS